MFTALFKNAVTLKFDTLLNACRIGHFNLLIYYVSFHSGKCNFFTNVEPLPVKRIYICVLTICIFKNLYNLNFILIARLLTFAANYKQYLSINVVCRRLLLM